MDGSKQSFHIHSKCGTTLRVVNAQHGVPRHTGRYLLILKPADEEARKRSRLDSRMRGNDVGRLLRKPFASDGGRLLPGGFHHADDLSGQRIRDVVRRGGQRLSHFGGE